MGVAERRERERQARKATVLDAARRLVLEKGFRGATTKEIAEQCELSEATLFFYFKNKDEIMLSLLFESIRFWGDGLRKLKESKLTGENHLDEIWQLYENIGDEHPEYFVIFAYLSQPNSLQGVSPEVKDEIINSLNEEIDRRVKTDMAEFKEHMEKEHMSGRIISYISFVVACAAMGMALLL